MFYNHVRKLTKGGPSLAYNSNGVPQANKYQFGGPWHKKVWEPPFLKVGSLEVCKSDGVQMEVMEPNGTLHLQVCNSDSAHMDLNRPLQV